MANKINDENIVNSLSEKIRNQAQRLRNLEEYRLLCEKTLVLLCPNIQLPLNPEKLETQGLNLVEQLNVANEKIKRLENDSKNFLVPLGENYTFPFPSSELSFAQLKELYSAIYFQHHRMIKEKKNSEESLRAEIQYSEEQKAYIEVLKQSIEHSSKASYGSGSNTVKYHSLEEENSPEIFENKKNLDLKLFFEEKQKTEIFLQEAAEALDYAEQEVRKLEIDNQDLTEKIEKYKENESKLHEEIDKLVKNLTKLDLQHKNTLEMLKLSEDNKKKLENECKRLKDSLHQLESLKKDVINKSYENKLKSVEQDLETIKKQNLEQKNQNFLLLNENKHLKQTLESTKTELENMNSIIISNNTKISEFEDRSKDFRKKIHEIELKLEKSEKILANKDETIQKLKKSFADIQESSENKLKQMESLWNETKEKTVELMQKKFDGKEKNYSEEILRFKQINEKIGKELNSSKENAQNLGLSLEKAEEIKKKLENEIKKLEISVNLGNSANILLEDENTLLKKRLDEEETKKNTFLKTINNKENELKAAINDLDHLKAQLKEKMIDVNSESRQKSQIFDENSKLKQEILSLSYYKSLIDEGKTIISRFSNNFGAICAHSSTFSLLLSDQLKDLIFKSNNQAIILIIDWIKGFCEETESLLRKLSELKQDYSNNSLLLDSKIQKISLLSENLKLFEENERNYKNQIETLIIEKEKYINEKEIIKTKLQSANYELNTIKHQFLDQNQEMSLIIQDFESAKAQIFSLKNQVSDQAIYKKKIEAENWSLKEEKKFMNKLLIKLQNNFPEADLDFKYSELSACNKTETEKKYFFTERTRVDRDVRSLSYDFFKSNY